MKNSKHLRSSLKRGTQTMTKALSRTVKSHRANALQVSGLAVFASGAFVLAPWLGLFVAGGFLAAIGWAIDE